MRKTNSKQKKLLRGLQRKHQAHLRGQALNKGWTRDKPEPDKGMGGMGREEKKERAQYQCEKGEKKADNFIYFFFRKIAYKKMNKPAYAHFNR